MRRNYYNENSKKQPHETKISQRKSLGQVFLNTDWPVKRVVEQLGDLHVKRVIEIGPGNGILTEALATAGIKVTAIEKDDRFAERLSERIRRGELHGVEIINRDILQFDLEHWIQAAGHEPAAVVGNIPYNISTPIVMWTLPLLSKLKAAVFMVQLEFAQRLSAACDTKDYGSLSVYCQLRAFCDFNFKVDKTCFNPIPKVDSAVITLRPRAEALAKAATLQYAETICRIVFTQRRKKLRNTIKPFLKDRDDSECPIDLNRRPETLTPLDFIHLTEFLFHDKI
jgi:16S rRNA (adenine1518-N6/adenine1519-N6)-dimethyltransferase